MQHQVDVAQIPDYHSHVKIEDEMWLQHISQKIKCQAYSKISEFRADIEQILVNCRAYNSPGCGIFGSPGKLP